MKRNQYIYPLLSKFGGDFMETHYTLLGRNNPGSIFKFSSIK